MSQTRIEKQRLGEIEDHDSALDGAVKDSEGQKEGERTWRGPRHDNSEFKE